MLRLGTITELQDEGSMLEGIGPLFCLEPMNRASPMNQGAADVLVQPMPSWEWALSRGEDQDEWPG